MLNDTACGCLSYLSRVRGIHPTQSLPSPLQPAEYSHNSCLGQGQHSNELCIRGREHIFDDSHWHVRVRCLSELQQLNDIDAIRGSHPTLSPLAPVHADNS
jgi:hypothetical protein